jgi:single-strand DNA-binding protein
MINKVTLIGNVGKLDDGKEHYKKVGADISLYNFGLALTEKGYDSDTKEKTKKTTWVTVTAWRHTADYCNNYLATGALVYVDGKIDISSYENSEGQTVKAFKIIANSITILKGFKDSGNTFVSNQKQEDVPF